MRDLGDHAAHRSRVDTFGDAVDLAEAERFERLAHFDRAGDPAAHLADADRLTAVLDLAHASAPSVASSPPRRALYCSAVRSSLSASNVALTTLCGLAVPSDLVRMFWMPADSRMARTGPPAMTPVPSEAGLSRTCPAP